MSTNPIEPAAAGALASALVDTIERVRAPRPVLRQAVVEALARAFAPTDLQDLVAELTEHQRFVCETARREQLATAAAELGDGRLEHARQAAQAAVQLDFTSPQSHRVLAEILEEAGDPMAAHTEYLLASHLGCEDAGTRAAIARTAGQPGGPENGTPPAERRYRFAVERTIACIENRDLDSARRYARLAVSLDPARPEGFNLLGVLAELTGRRGEARTQYRIALELAPGFRPAVENLARSARPWTERGRPVW